MTRLQNIVRRVEQAEDSLIAALFLLMLGLSVIQIAARNFGFGGVSGGDDIARLLVLWVGLLGATAAARHDKHLRMDLFSKLFAPRMVRILKVLAHGATALISGIAAYAALRYVGFEYEDGTTAFGHMPVWLCMSVIPFALGVLSLRYMLFTLDEVMAARMQRGHR